jgi:uncharacterized protein DUF6279
MRLLRLLIIILFIMLMAGCSRIKFAYNQLDWLIPLYLGRYIDLSARQRNELDKQVDRLLAWHCSNQLHRYAALLRTANTDFQTDQVTAQRLHEISLQIEEYWDELMRQINPEIARLLVSANNEQLKQLFQNLDEKNQDWLNEYNDKTTQELNLEYQQNMLETLEYWLGPLENIQMQMVNVWADEFVPLGLDGLYRRKNWQAKLHALTMHRHDPAFHAQIKQLFLEPEQFRSSSYQQRLENNRNATIKLLVHIANSLTAPQKKHLNNEILSIAQDFDELSCKNKTVFLNTIAPFKQINQLPPEN